MKSPQAFIFTVAVALSLAAQKPQQDSIYLLSDNRTHEWCAFHDESLWRSEAAARDSTIFATLGYTDSQLSSLEISTEDETGDWTVLDRYRLGEKGNLRQLERRISILPGRRLILQRYDLTYGDAKLKSNVTKPLNPGESSSNETWLPEVRIAIRRTDFQFTALLQMKHSDLTAKPHVCVAAGSGAP